MTEKIELYSMVLVNRDQLTNAEQLSLLKARLALRQFERAMLAFSAIDAPVCDKVSVGGYHV